jgi:steroid 5-alpha reductase family enzyme
LTYKKGEKAMMMFLVLLVIVLHMCFIWLWYRLTNNPSVVDVGWASGLSLSGLMYLGQNPLSVRTVVLGGALLIWGLRLGGYLWWTRIRKKHIDKRYTALSGSWNSKEPLGFFINFQLQGLFIFIVSLSWYFISLNSSGNLSLMDLIGLLIFGIALSLETLADVQLQRFKKNNPGQLCTTQLWRLSRHPNCFFEWLVWCSFTFFAASSPFGLLSLISPLALYLIMCYLTIPITERESIKSRGQAYTQYQATTPKFFPKAWSR